MDRNESLLDDSEKLELRKQAESRLEELDIPDEEEMTPAEMRRELQLQRIEIQLQKEQLERYRHQLEQSREQYRDLYFNAPVGYITVDEEGVVGKLNYLAAELLGETRETIAESTLFDHVHPDSRPRLKKHFDEVFDSTGTHHCELKVELPTGNDAHLKMLSIAVDDQDSGQLQCRAALFDITEQFHARQKKAQLEEQLEQSHRLQTIGRLASGIAHDFNNLLTLIIGYSKLAINQLPDDHLLAKHVREINKAGHHASELIEQLLAFSRSGDSQSATVDPNELIDEMETMFDRLIGDEIELHVRLHAPIGAVQFDASQFQQVLLNLVVNARDAMAEGGNLYLRTRNVHLTDQAAGKIGLSGGPHVVVEVEDEGDGIPTEVIPHIFEPFFTTKSADKHRGFGLSTTYGIVRRHGGAIDVVSNTDSGTTFCIYLPRVDEDEEQLRNGDQQPVILIVDDQPDLRDFASLVLEEMNVEVLTASCPEEALQLSQACGPELALVIADVTMPGLNGPQLLERVRRVHSNTDVLYMSGYDRQTLQQETDMPSDAPLLEKPFSPDVLYEMVDSLLQ